LTIFVLLAGCSLVNSPKAALQRFAKAVEKNDMKALVEVATPEAVELVAMFGTKIQGYLATAAAEKGKVKTVTETIDGDTAVVTVAYENGEEENFDLIKVDGKWKVNISMDFK
jgi:ketosteroid isomerase-like protein